MRQPGERFRDFASRFCDARTLERIVEPAIADMQHEYAEASARGQRARALLIEAAGFSAVVRALGIALITDSPLGRGMLVTCAGVVVLTILLDAIPMWKAVHGGLAHPQSIAATVEALAYLLPQAFCISIPLGLVAAVVFGWRDASERARSRRIILAITLAWTAVGFANIAWVTPIANQRFRAMMFAGSLPPGANELTLSELRRRVEVEKRDPGVARARMADARGLPLALSYHLRLAVAASPLILTAFAVTAAGIRRRFLRRATTIAGIGMFLSCYVLFGPEHLLLALRWLSPPVIPWIPNAIVMTFTVATMAVISIGRRPERRA